MSLDFDKSDAAELEHRTKAALMTQGIIRRMRALLLAVKRKGERLELLEAIVNLSVCVGALVHRSQQRAGKRI